MKGWVCLDGSTLVGFCNGDRETGEVLVTLSPISGQFEIGLSCLLRPSTRGVEDHEGQAIHRGADHLRAAPG